MGDPEKKDLWSVTLETPHGDGKIDVKEIQKARFFYLAKAQEYEEEWHDPASARTLRRLEGWLGLLSGLMFVQEQREGVSVEATGMLAEAIEYHESMIPELEPEGDITQFEEERAYHQRRIEWLKELAKLRERVARQDETILGFKQAQEEQREEAGGVTTSALRRLHKRLSQAEAEKKGLAARLEEYERTPQDCPTDTQIEDLEEKLARSEDVRVSAERQNRNLIDDNRKLRDEKAALADVIADLKLDLKARE